MTQAMTTMTQVARGGGSALTQVDATCHGRSVEVSNTVPSRRVIKRYANRKMYDTSRSCYVTLEEVAEMVRAGQDVQVIDNRTKQDVTEVTLTQALLDSERRNRGTVPLTGLRHLIASGNEFLHKRVTEPVIRARTEAERSIQNWRSEAERSIQTWKTEAERRAERVLHRGPNEEAHGKAAAELDNSEHHRIDERIWQTLASLGLGRDADEIERLRARTQELEGRVQQLEAQVKALSAERRGR
jgi:polyhydroxyalkanoate synthesis repressor PhaR